MYEIKRNKYLVLNAAIPIAIGAILYYLFDPTVYFVQWIDEVTGVGCHINIQSNSFISIIRNHIFDAVWSYSLVFVLFGFIKLKNRILVSVLSAFTLGILLEVLQLVFPGTFDVFDIIAELISAVLAGILIKHWRQK